jgi:hypothetical protein
VDVAPGSRDPQKPKRRGPGRPFQKGHHPSTEFKKGQSGNPSGRHAIIANALNAFCDPGDLEKLRKKILHIALHSVDERVSLTAADMYYNRAAGKPVQAITGPGGGPVQVETVDLSKLDADALRELERIRKLATGE